MDVMKPDMKTSVIEKWEVQNCQNFKWFVFLFRLKFQRVTLYTEHFSRDSHRRVQFMSFPYYSVYYFTVCFEARSNVQQRQITSKFYTTHESIAIQGDMDVIDLVK